MIHEFKTSKSAPNQKIVIDKPKVPELVLKEPIHSLLTPKTIIKNNETPTAPSVTISNETPPKIKDLDLAISKLKDTKPIKETVLEAKADQDSRKKDLKYSAYKQDPEPNKYYEGLEEDAELLLGTVDIPKTRIKTLVSREKYQVYNMGDFVTDERKAIMPHLGLDIGTKTIVAAFKDKSGQVNYISEINGFWPFERATPFIENMLKDSNKVRSDGTKRPAHFFKHEETNQCIVLGRDAEEFAYSKNDTLKRPMAEGGITPDEMSMTVLSSIIHGILNTAEKDLGKFDSNLTLCYCTTAPALNKKNNIEYHERVVDIILKGYNTESAIKLQKIKESHAIVLNMSPDGTGIGISWGAGTVTVTYVKYGLEVYSFCWVGAGDWIDENVAIRHGYDPNALRTMKKASKETPTTVAKAKMSVDLTPGMTYDDRLMLDISLHYDVLINQVINGIISGFQEHEAEARIEDGVNVYMAGGTSSPKGFPERVALLFSKTDLPFVLGTVTRSDKPLYTVASGCLTAAEMFES